MNLNIREIEYILVIAAEGDKLEDKLKHENPE